MRVFTDKTMCMRFIGPQKKTYMFNRKHDWATISISMKLTVGEKLYVHFGNASHIFLVDVWLFSKKDSDRNSGVGNFSATQNNNYLNNIRNIYHLRARISKHARNNIWSRTSSSSSIHK